MTDYFKGMDACKAGDPCPEDASSSFKMGYGRRYEIEQCLPHLSQEKAEKVFEDARLLAQDIRSKCK